MKKQKHIYFVGIKGVAMTALAVFFKEKGCAVSGSDVEDVFITDEILHANNISVKKGFSADNITRDIDQVVVTGAHGGMTNPEAQKALELNIPTLMHGKMLGQVMQQTYGISVAGCHGKTTTSAMISSLLSHGGLQPSYAVGTSRINDLGAAGHFGSGKFFVAEADEYMTCPVTDPTPRFFWQHPRIIVLTNIDYDHPDAYASIEDVKHAYSAFIEHAAPDTLVIACIDDANVQSILPGTKKKIITYGFSEQADVRITAAVVKNQQQRVTMQLNSQEYVFRLSVPGRHNAANAAAAVLAAHTAGMSLEEITLHLPAYTGVKRRFEKITERHNVLFYDDYAHHPSEITSTIQAVKEWFEGKSICVIFQPHTYSRTKSLLNDFAASFTQADTVLVADIYPSAREKIDATISSKLLVEKINERKQNAVYTPDKKAVIDYMKKHIDRYNVLITMGAGDVYTWQTDLARAIW